MSNVKISLFNTQSNISSFDGLAGYEGTTNKKISGTELVASLESTLNLSNFAVGTLPVGRGGTGATTFTANSVLIGNGTSAISDSGTLTDG